MEYRGVHWREDKNKWVVKMRHDGKIHHLGYFHNPVTAASVWDCAKRLTFGWGEYNFDGQAPPEYPEEKVRQMLIKKGILRGE